MVFAVRRRSCVWATVAKASKGKAMKGIPITEKELARYRRVVGECATVAEAATRLGMNPGTLSQTFLRHGIRPASLLKKSQGKTLPPPARLDPVARREAQDRAAQMREEADTLVEQLRDARARQAFLDRMSNGAIPILPRMQKRSGPREMCAVAMLSDLHVEERVQAVEPFEEYNLEIAGRRLERLFQGVIDLVKHHRADGHYLINYLVCWLGGDFMTGYLHEDNVRTSQLSPSETSLWLMPRLEGGLRAMLSELDLEHIEVPCSFGNHGRSTIKPMVAAAAENSFEWLLYHTLAHRMKDEKRVHFHITKSAYQYVSVYDFSLMFHHGDHVRYQGGVLGPGVPFMKAVDAWNTTKFAHYTHIGHLHNYGVFGRGVMNGSLIGHSPYSMFVKARKEDPCQAFYLLDAKRGMAMNTRLWVGEGSVR